MRVWLQIRVWFTADVSDDMPWKFTPTQEYVTVHPGESVLAFFTAQNRRCAHQLLAWQEELEALLSQCPAACTVLQ